MVFMSNSRSGSAEYKETQRQFNSAKERQMDYWKEKVRFSHSMWLWVNAGWIYNILVSAYVILDSPLLHLAKFVAQNYRNPVLDTNPCRFNSMIFS